MIVGPLFLTPYLTVSGIDISLTILSLFLGIDICNLDIIASAFFGSLAFYASLLSIKISQAFAFTSLIPSPLMLLIYITNAFVSFANSSILYFKSYYNSVYFVKSFFVKTITKGFDWNRGLMLLNNEIYYSIV